MDKVKTSDSPHTFKDLHQYFVGINFTELKYPNIIKSAINVLPDDIPFKMKLFIAVNECGTLVSNLGNPIRLNSKTMVTTNMQNIMFSKSGSSKDMAVNTIRSNFKEAYDAIQDKAYEESVQTAKELCAEAEKGKTENWQEYYVGNSRTLFPAISTPEGMLAQMNILQQTSTLAYNMKIGELGSELKSNPMGLLVNLKLLAEGYDVGFVPSNIVKTNDLQTPEITKLNINSLMFSSVDTLLKDKAVRDRFVDYMTIQGTRRSMMYMNTSGKIIKESTSLVEYLNKEADADNSFEKGANELAIMSELILKSIPTGQTSFIDFPKADKVKSLTNLNARGIYHLYKYYNAFRSAKIPEKYKMKAISTEHLHWKALKLSGLFAMLNGKMSIEPIHMLQAISVVEYFNDDVRLFQIEIDKEVYERIVDYMRLRAIKGKLAVTKHNLIKEGFITQNISDNKMKELAELCTNSDADGIYMYAKGKLMFKKLSSEAEPEEYAEDTTVPVEEKEETNSISNKTTAQSNLNSDNSKPVKLSYKTYKLSNGEPMIFDDPKEFKEYRNNNGEKGWVNVVTPFAGYLKLITNNTSMSPYHFGNGKNSKGELIEGYKTLDTIISTSDTIILDVDESILSIEETHELLESYTHIIATTSDNTNLYKFRIILRLDRDIDLTPPQWKKFYLSIGTLLGVEVDHSINKASMFHGYANSVVYSNLNGKMLDAKPHMIAAYNATPPKEIVPVKTQKQFEMSWDNRFETFEFAYTCNRQRSTTLYRAMRVACKLGWEHHWVAELIEEINDTLDRRLPRVRLEKILSQIHKFIE